MSKSPTDKKRKVSSGTGTAFKVLEIDGILRMRVRELEEVMGVLPLHREAAERKGGSTSSIYDRMGATPGGMAGRFPDEIAVMRRMGKTVDECYVMEFKPYRVSCLPYFYYDGFHALLYVEKQGEFAAGWRALESDRIPPALSVMVRRAESGLQRFLEIALATAKH